MTLDEVRVNIDRVDKEIKKLFIERMQLADQVACVKAQTGDSIYKPDREAAIIEKNSKDIDEKLVREYTALIKRIMEVSRKYQYGRTLELRDCFPFEYITEEPKLTSVAVKADEMAFAGAVQAEKTVSVDSFEEIGRKITDGTVDFGMGVMEEIGKSVSDDLNTMLAGNNLYINDCKVVESDGRRIKLVTFGRTLVVRETDNRLKVMFTCPDRAGSLGSILCQIADYGVNLTEIHSKPDGKTENWNYEMYVEMDLSLIKKEGQALLFQLSNETESLKILGSYRV